MADVIKRRSSPRRKAAKNRTTTAVILSGSWLNEALAVISIALAVFILISFMSYEIGVGAVPGFSSSHYDPRHNVMGPAGHALGTLLSGFFGWCALVPVFWLVWLALY